MPKAPFERIFSLTERKKILTKVAKDQIKIVIKNNKNMIFELKAESVDSAFNLCGQLGIKDIGPIRDFEKVTALFYLGNERYFLTTRIKFRGEQWILLNDQQFYKFNRRSAFRVSIPDDVDIIFQIFTVRNIEMNKSLSVIEFSSGGARLKSNSDIKFSPGTILKGSLQWNKGKVLPVDALIVHVQEKNFLGVKFINLTTSTQNRLKMLSVEIQQIIHFA